MQKTQSSGDVASANQTVQAGLLRKTASGSVFGQNRHVFQQARQHGYIRNEADTLKQTHIASIFLKPFLKAFTTIVSKTNLFGLAKTPLVLIFFRWHVRSASFNFTYIQVPTVQLTLCNNRIPLQTKKQRYFKCNHTAQERNGIAPSVEQRVHGADLSCKATPGFVFL